MGKFNKMLSNTGNAVKGMSKGKKIYASLWALTGVFLITLIGVLVGFNTTLGVKNDAKGSWTVKENYTPHAELKYEDANNNKQFDKGEKITIDGVDVISIVPQNQTTIAAADVTETQFANFNKLYDNSKWVHVWDDFSKVKVSATDAKYTATNLADSLKGVKEAKVVYKIDAPDFKNGADTTFTYATVQDSKDATKLEYKPLNGYVTYSYDAWTDGPLTKNARSEQNTIASVGALFALAITGSIFTTAAVEYNRKKGGKK